MADDKPSADLARQQYYASLGLDPNTNPQDLANKTFAPGSMGRISNAYQGQQDSNLDYLKGRLGGLTADENRAQMEQGQQNVSDEISQNMERYASAAGASGVGGGARAALMGKALRQGNQDTAAYSRQLILDNVNQKNQAANQYTGALGQAQDRGLGVQQYNLGQQNAELYGRTSMPFQLASGASAQDAANWTKYFGGKQIDLGQQGVDAFKATGGYGGSNYTAPASDVKNAPDGTHTGGSIPQYDKGFSDSEWATGQQYNNAKMTAADKGAQDAGYANFSDWASRDMSAAQAFTSKWATDHPAPKATQTAQADVNTQVTDAAAQEHASRPTVIICTESLRQGLVDPKVFSQANYDGAKYVTQRQLFAYWRWGSPVVRVMRKSRLFARVMAALVPLAVNEMSRRVGTRTGRINPFGWLVVEAFDALNALFSKNEVAVRA